MKSGLFRNVTIIASSTMLTQAALLLFMPLLTRIYSPEIFGAFSVYSSIHAIVLIVSTLKYDTAIVIDDTDDRARNLLTLSILLSASTGAVFLILLAFAFRLYPEHISQYYLLIPFSVVFASACSGLQQWGARHRAYRRYALAQIINTAFNLTASVTFAVLMPGQFNGLIAGFVIGGFAAATYLLFALTRSTASSPFNQAVTVRGMKAAAVAYSHMPKYVLPFTILIVIAHSAAPIILQSSYTLTDVGNFAVASRILLAPATILGGAIGEPYRAELAAKLRDGLDVGRTSGLTILFLTAVGAVGFTLIFLLSPWFFSFAFGPDFAVSGQMARYICIGAFGQFVALPVTYTFVMTGHLRTGLAAMAAVAFVPSGALWIVAQRWPIEDALLLSSLLVFACSAILVYLAHRCALSPIQTRKPLESST